jgi:hypothetical protein
MPNKNNNSGARAETREMPMLTLRAAFAPSTFNAEKRTVELVWTTGAKGLRRGWDGEYFEELEVSESAVRLERLNNGAPFLAVHEGWSLDSVIGVVERAWIKNGEGRALVRFSERDEVQSIVRDVQTGVLRNISVGYQVHKYLRIKSLGADGKPDGGIDTYRAVDWEPMEISIVPIGFDDGAKIRSSDTNKKNKVTITQRDQSMSNEIDDQTDDNTGDEIIEPTTPAARAAVRAERRRVAEIMKLAKVERGFDDFAAELIRSGVSLAEARVAFIDEMAERQERTQPNTRSQWIEGGDAVASTEHLSRSLGDAIFSRIDPTSRTVDEKNNPFAGRSMLEIAREYLHIRGQSTRGMSPAKIVDLATRGYHGVDDFPSVLGDAVNRELLKAWDSVDAGVVRAARLVTARDFRNHHPIRLGDAPKLLPVGEHSEYKRGTIVEAAAPAWKLGTWGRMFGLSRHAIINDDLSAFVNLPRMFGIIAREFESEQVVALLTSSGGAGPEIDGQPLFHASHGNLAASGGAISVTTLGAARAAMRRQKNLDGRVINIVPKWLLVPASLETVAQQLLTEIDATKPSDTNPFAGRLTLLVDPRLDDASLTRWYLLGDQTMGGLEVAHLDNSRANGGPTIETQAGWDVDGVEWKVSLDFGCGITDFRTLYSNPGA